MPAESNVAAMGFAVRTRKSAAPFFRDPADLKAMRRAARPRLDALKPGEPLRVWVPQSAGGEDAYSVAIALFEELGPCWRETPLCVFSTDADEDALFRARAGRYPSAAGRGIPRAKLGRFFAVEAGRLRVRRFVREACRFVHHLPAQKPPFSRLDLIVARDLLAGQPATARGDVLRVFHAALAPGGLLLDATGAAAEASEFFLSVRRGRSYAARDLTARAPRRAGRTAPALDVRLLESEEKLRLLLAKTGEAILVQDEETGLILEANAAAEGLFGFRAAELTALRGEELRALPERVRRPVGERRSEERLRLPHFVRKDGTMFPADASKTFLMLKGRPCNLWMLRDATPRLRASSGRRSAEAREAFVGDVVHELRSPISVIQGSVETLRKGVRGSRARAAFLRFIETHAGRMAGLVDQLLELGAAGSPAHDAQPRRVELSGALREIVAAFAPVAKRRGVSIKIDVAEDLAVRVDPGDVPHIFGNLIDNAVKFTPRGGMVLIQGRTEGQKAVVTVRDTGEGISPKNLERVFERFFRGEKARGTKGTGLGLAIVKRIVQANRGRVSAENDPAGGAVFRVALPLDPGGAR